MCDRLIVPLHLVPKKKGVSPSEPREPGNSNIVEATARAATHANIEPTGDATPVPPVVATTVSHSARFRPTAT